MKKVDQIPSEKLEAYERLVATVPAAERKGASMPYTSRNGHMFSFLAGDGTLSQRLSEDEREAFLKKYKTELSEQHGRIMKEYAVVPDRLLEKTGELTQYFEMSFAYVGSLKPKPTKKKVAKKASTKEKTVKKAASKKRAR